MIDEGSPGDIFGPKVAGRGERDFVGKNVVHLVDILAAALSSARSYNAAIRAEQVRAPVLLRAPTRHESRDKNQCRMSGAVMGTR